MTTDEGHGIRYFLNPCVGLKLLDITQNDEPCDDPNGRFIEFLFEKGSTIRLYTKDSPSFRVDHPDDCGCELCMEEDL